MPTVCGEKNSAVLGVQPGMPSETTTIWMVTVKPLIHTTTGTILIIVSLIDIFLLATLARIVRAKHAKEWAILVLPADSCQISFICHIPKFAFFFW